MILGILAYLIITIIHIGVYGLAIQFLNQRLFHFTKFWQMTLLLLPWLIIFDFAWYPFLNDAQVVISFKNAVIEKIYGTSSMPATDLIALDLPSIGLYLVQAVIGTLLGRKAFSYLKETRDT